MLAVLANDENMIQAASEGKDLYTAVAARAFHTTYEDCLEHFPEGTPIIKKDDKWYYATEEEIKENKGIKYADGENDTYVDGRNRRTQAKIILLGLMYSRGATALAEQLGCSLDEAKSIMQSVYDGFPKIREFERESKEFCKKSGYTTTLWGRKRRLTDIKLPRYDFTFKSDVFPPLPERHNIIKEYTKKFDAVYWDRKKKSALIKSAEDEFNCKIKDNTGFIAQAERQIVNARVQGSAADMTKKALVAINNNKELKELGFSTITPIHDEIIGQCPLANVKKCKELFIYEMCNAANDKMKIKITTDPAISFEWYGEPLSI